MFGDAPTTSVAPSRNENTTCPRSVSAGTAACRTSVPSIAPLNVARRCCSPSVRRPRRIHRVPRASSRRCASASAGSARRHTTRDALSASCRSSRSSRLSSPARASTSSSCSFGSSASSAMNVRAATALRNAPRHDLPGVRRVRRVLVPHPAAREEARPSRRHRHLVHIAPDRHGRHERESARGPRDRARRCRPALADRAGGDAHRGQSHQATHRYAATHDLARRAAHSRAPARRSRRSRSADRRAAPPATTGRRRRDRGGRPRRRSRARRTARASTARSGAWRSRASCRRARRDATSRR